MQIFAGMDLVADIDAMLLGQIKQRPPARGERVKGRLDQTGRALRPWIEIGPGQCARKGRHPVQPQKAADPDRLGDLIYRPFLACRRVSTQGRRRESVKAGVIGRMYGNKLPLQVA